MSAYTGWISIVGMEQQQRRKYVRPRARTILPRCYRFRCRIELLLLLSPFSSTSCALPQFFFLFKNISLLLLSIDKWRFPLLTWCAQTMSFTHTPLAARPITFRLEWGRRLSISLLLLLCRFFSLWALISASERINQAQKYKTENRNRRASAQSMRGRPS